MEDILKQLLKYVVDFDDRTLEIISQHLKPQFFRKNSMLLSQGDVCNEFYFVIEGCIRTCFISKEGDEKTRYIMLGPSMGTALTSFITQQPSFEFLDALEDTNYTQLVTPISTSSIKSCHPGHSFIQKNLNLKLISSKVFEKDGIVLLTYAKR